MPGNRGFINNFHNEGFLARIMGFPSISFFPSYIERKDSWNLIVFLHQFKILYQPSGKKNINLFYRGPTQ
ncbi:hypothetical protein GLYMA_06G152100v4 [Glycine max]|uniref:Uncharacterized protein n=1 Tax=Glycine max TaxID=3847 RepID=K7KV69_SOYBN|nr:hypothetical protein GYH30_015179 [Glycine max]KRH53879.1 hypothetical protein GLYMA_06G152100v4 [Glycine max]